MVLPRKFKELCTPSLVYFIIAMFGLIIVAIQNMTSDSNTLRIGLLNMYVPNLMLVFFLKLLYILFWTWVLNLMCRDGHSEISWLLILVPFMMVFMGLLFAI